MDINCNMVKSDLNKKGQAPIRFQFSFNKTQFILSSGEKCLAKAWNKEAQAATKKDSDHIEINSRLAKKREILIQIIKDSQALGLTFSKKDLRIKFKQKSEEIFNNVPHMSTSLTVDNERKNVHDLKSVIEYFIKHYPKKSAPRKWKQIKTHLFNFSSSIDFKDFTENFYNDYFLTYLVNQGLCDNSIDMHIAQIKNLCNYTRKNFPFIEVPYHFDNYDRIYYSPQRIALNWDEVESIENYSPKEPLTILAKDLFLIACNTGLRWQDISTLNKDMFEKKGDKFYFDGLTQKNKKPLRFQLTPKVISILERYDFTIPKNYNCKINEQLHKMAKACGLDDEVRVIRRVNMQNIITYKPKWEVITMHLGRHTFACEYIRRNKHLGLNALKALCKQLNHSSVEVTQIYWNMEENEADQILMSSFG